MGFMAEDRQKARKTGLELNSAAGFTAQFKFGIFGEINPASLLCKINSLVCEAEQPFPVLQILLIASSI